MAHIVVLLQGARMRAVSFHWFRISGAHSAAAVNNISQRREEGQLWVLGDSRTQFGILTGITASTAVFIWRYEHFSVVMFVI